MSPPELPPEDFLYFYELDEFAEDWKQIGYDIENDLWALQIAIMTNPEAGRVVPDSGGLRKIRFASAREGRGKRGSARVCYVHFKEHGNVLLVVAYGKNDKDDLSPSEKKRIREYIRRTQKWLDERYK
jgi:hypothetical protein